MLSTASAYAVEAVSDLSLRGLPMASLQIRVWTNSNTSALSGLLPRSVSGAAVQTCVFSIHTGSIKTLLTNTMRSSWSTPSTRLSAGTQGSTGLWNQFTSTERAGVLLLPERSRGASTRDTNTIKLLLAGGRPGRGTTHRATGIHPWEVTLLRIFISLTMLLFQALPLGTTSIYWAGVSLCFSFFKGVQITCQISSHGSGNSAVVAGITEKFKLECFLG